MDDTRRPEDGKEKDVNQSTPISQERDAREHRRDQSHRHERCQPENLIAGVEILELRQFQRIAQAVGVQVKEQQREIDCGKAETVDNEERRKFRARHHERQRRTAEEETK